MFSKVGRKGLPWPGASGDRLRSTASSYGPPVRRTRMGSSSRWAVCPRRSEEHTSELQSHLNLVCRLLLEKKKNNRRNPDPIESAGWELPQLHRPPLLA